jgi:cytochrome c oxidase subunit 1
MSETTNATEIKPEDIHMPPPSFWPIVLAFGFTLILTGLAIHYFIAIVGIITTFVSILGWIIEPVHDEEGEHH